MLPVYITAGMAILTSSSPIPMTSGSSICSDGNAEKYLMAEVRILTSRSMRLTLATTGIGGLDSRTFLAAVIACKRTLALELASSFLASPTTLGSGRSAHTCTASFVLAGMSREEAAKQLCANLANEEIEHKNRLETLYDRLFYGGG